MLHVSGYGAPSQLNAAISVGIPTVGPDSAEVLAGDLGAIDRFLKISDARRKLLGLDVPRTTRHLHDFGSMTRDKLIQYIASRIGQTGYVGSGGGGPEDQYLPGPRVIDGDLEVIA